MCKFFADLVQTLNNFQSLSRLDITMRVPTNNGPTCVQLDQFHHMLPFYDVNYIRWRLWWFAPGLASPEVIPAEGLDYMDREMAKVKAKRHKLRREQGRLANEVKYIVVR